MRRVSAFTLVELLIAVGILTVLAGLASLNAAQQQRNSRDANRKDSLRGYQSALEQYRLATGTYFVYAGKVTATAPTVTVSGGRMRLSGDSKATGTTGGGWGGLNYPNPQNATVSIAAVLQQDGYLTAIRRDPSNKTADSYDYQLSLCQAGGTAPGNAQTPLTALEYGLVAKLEGTNGDATTTATGTCDAGKAISTLSTTNAHTFAVASRRW